MTADLAIVDAVMDGYEYNKPQQAPSYTTTVLSTMKSSLLNYFLLVIALLSTFSTAFVGPAAISTCTRRSSSSLTTSTRIFFGVGTIEEQEDQYIELASKNTATAVPESVTIILYNPGTEIEGAHTTECPRGSGFYSLLGFESPFEGHHFAELIAGAYPDYPVPVPTPYTLEEVQLYATNMGWTLQLVPEF